MSWRILLSFRPGLSHVNLPGVSIHSWNAILVQEHDLTWPESWRRTASRELRFVFKTTTSSWAGPGCAWLALRTLELTHNSAGRVMPLV